MSENKKRRNFIDPVTAAIGLTIIKTLVSFVTYEVAKYLWDHVLSKNATVKRIWRKVKYKWKEIVNYYNNI